jgi:LPS-assembly protein
MPHRIILARRRGHNEGRWRWPSLLFFLLFFLAAPLLAEQTLISADNIENDDKTQTVLARGNVEITDQGRVLKAEEASFNQIDKTVQARDDVALVEADGTVMFAREGTLSSDMADGFAKNVGMLMPDDSRFAARDARRARNRYVIFSRGLYSPCALCKEDPKEPPLWQLKASRIVHDNQSHDIMYRDATMEMFGAPIFYIPYFSHPDPTVKRRQGFLTGTIGRNADVGAIVKTPYYFDIAPDFDYTLIPTFTSEDNPRWGGILRKRFNRGAIEFQHSLAIADRTDEDGTVKKDQIRGHLQGFMRFDLDNIYRTGAEFAVLTDKNYLRRYSESSEDTLTNRVYLEGFKGRDFSALEFFYFQDNRPGARPEQPLTLPRIRYNMLGEPNAMLGGRWSFDGLVTALQREDGADTRKFGVDFGWERRDILPMGFVSTLKGSVRNDLFWVDNLQDPTTPVRQFDNDFTNRLFPQGQATISYPVAAYYDSFSHVVEPIAAFTVSPRYDYDPRIPNEDSVDVEFDTTNLFDLNRYPGSDQQEQGARLTYGLKTGFYGNKQGMAEFMFGQNYRITDDPLFPAGSGLENSRSDYVGKATLQPGSWLYVDYFFRLEESNFNFLKHDLFTSAGIPEFRPYVRYLNLTPPSTLPGAVGDLNEVTYGFSSNFVQYWTFVAEQKHNLLAVDNTLLTTTVGLYYGDECFNASLSFTRDNTVRTGVNSGDTYFFRFYFKNLGGFGGGTNDLQKQQ